MKNAQNYIQLAILLGILIVVNIIAQRVYTYIDLTEENGNPGWMFENVLPAVMAPIAGG